MSYVKNTWVDQDVERPKTYEVTNNQDGSITLTDSFGLITELGTPVNETNMNHIEEGIEGCAIRKHNLTETFDLGEWVLGVVNNEKGIYNSLVANNTGNSLEDTDYWEKVALGGGFEVGDVIWRPLPTQDGGKHLLDGALIDGSGSYAAFVSYIADLYADNPTANYFTDETTWQQSITDYGVCGKFVYDDVNNTVRLPKITGIVEGTIDASALGDLIEAGLPNITGGKTGRIIGDNVAWSGAFSGSSIGSNSAVAGGSGALVNNVVSFDASRSDSTYGNLATGAKNKVQPQTIKGYMYIVIANKAKTDIEVDIDEITTDLNGKADVDFTNVNNDGIAKCINWNMPYPAVGGWVPLTLPPANDTITMPEDGLLVFDTAGTIIGGYIFLTCGYYTEIRYVTETYGILRVSMKIPKGFVVQVGYVNAGALERFGYYKMKGNM